MSNYNGEDEWPSNNEINIRKINTADIYKNNQNKNYSLHGQGIHSKDLIKIWKVSNQKAGKEQSIQSHGTRAFMAAWRMERPPDLEVRTLLLGWVRHSPTLGLGWVRRTTRPEAVFCKGMKLVHQREDTPCPTSSSSAKCYHESLSHIWTPKPKGTFVCT